MRRVEEVVRKRGTGPGKKKAKEGPEQDPLIRALEEELRAALGTRVVLKRGKGERGVIEIPFLSGEDLERIFSLLAGKEVSEVVG